MRIAVVYPEVLDMARYRARRKEFPPFGALYIAASLERAGHTVEIFKIHPDKTALDLSHFEAIAFSISASATLNLFSACRTESNFRSGALLLAGGVHATLFPEQTVLALNVHAVGIGEGEDTILDLLTAKDARDFRNIPGICYLHQGTPRRTPPRRISRHMDNLPLPARHLLPREDFVMNDRMSNTNLLMTHVMLGRGCPFPCRFCAAAQTKVQYRRGVDIRAELIHLMEKYAINGFAVVGNDFILNEDNVRDVCDAVGDLNLSWATLARIDRVAPDLLLRMKSAGCYEVEFGVESGSAEILDAMDKRTSPDQVRNALEMSHDAGITNKIFLVHGYPGENMRTTNETIEFLLAVEQWIDRVSLFRFVPLPGTFVYNHPERFRLRGTPHSPDWDGNWGKFHIHHNHEHWWGGDDDFAELRRSFEVLRDHIESRWPSRFAAGDLPDDRWRLQSQQLAKLRPVEVDVVSARHRRSFPMLDK